MDRGGGSRYIGLIPTVRKKRSQMLRRPRTFPEYHDHSPLTSRSDNVGRVSRNKYTDDANEGGRICDLSYCICTYSSPERSKGDGGSSTTYNNARGGEDTNPMHGASLKQLENAGDGQVDEFRLIKLKMKIARVARIIQTKNSSYGSSSTLLSSKSAQPSDASQPRQNLTLQDKSSEHGPLADKKSGLKGISCEDLRGGSIGASKNDKEKMPTKKVFGKQRHKPHKDRKRLRVRRRLVLERIDEEEEEEEIHYLEKHSLGEESTKTTSLSRGLKIDKYETLEDVGRSRKEMKGISNRGSKYTNYEEKEPLSDKEAKQTKKKHKNMKEVYETPVETMSELSHTTRKRALLSGKEVKSISNRGPEYTDYEEKELLSDGDQAKRTKMKEKQMKESYETPVETKSEISLGKKQQALPSRRDSSATFVYQARNPYGKPPALPPKQKAKLSEVEQKEEKMKKQHEELAQEKAANELPPNTIRTVMSPTGNIVTFSNDIGLPSIFNSKPCSYPPPREKCAGPSCVNTYKYRHSKTRIPLCSLECYKAIQEKMQNEKAS